MSSLSENALNEILNCLPEPFSSLSEMQRLDLRGDINVLWCLYVRYDPNRNDKVPHQLIMRWRQIKAATKKLRKLIQGFESDIALEIDFINNGRQPVSCKPYEILKEMPWFGEIGDWFAKSNLIVPSDDAKKKVEEIEAALRHMNKISNSAIDDEQKYKNSTRKHNHFRYGFIKGLSLIYKNISGKEATNYRDGLWCLFLSKVLTVLEGEETTQEAAYKIWRKVAKTLPRAA
jgi:hypothetical protein